MGAEVGIAAAVGGGAVGLVFLYLLARLIVEPWKRLVDAAARAARAEGDRDVARADAEQWAGELARAKKLSAELDEEVARDAFPAVLPGTGTDELRRQLEAEDRGADDGAAAGDDGPGAVSHGAHPGGPGGDPRVPG